MDIKDSCRRQGGSDLLFSYVDDERITAPDEDLAWKNSSDYHILNVANDRRILIPEFLPYTVLGESRPPRLRILPLKDLIYRLCGLDL